MDRMQLISKERDFVGQERGFSAGSLGQEREDNEGESIGQRYRIAIIRDRRSALGHPSDHLVDRIGAQLRQALTSRVPPFGKGPTADPVKFMITDSLGVTSCWISALLENNPTISAT